MLYVITEDTNSARSFWNIVAKTFRGDDNYILVSLLKDKNGKEVGGNTTLENQVNTVLFSMNKSDELLIAFDYISNFSPFDFIKNTHNKCKVLGITCKFTNYYCFEEVYLVVSWYQCMKKRFIAKKWF